MFKVQGFAAFDPTSPLSAFTVERREVGEHDVQIEILYVGICHSDLHQIRNHWGETIYPIVPGHEIVGKVVKIGANVKELSVGDNVGVGCLVNSCRICSSCCDGLEQYCEEGPVFTYNSLDKDLKITYGGLTDQIVVDQNFVVKIPSGLDLRSTAPLLCAGITVYSPLRHWQIGEGHRVGIIGVGGVGHLGIKMAAAFGAEVTMITGNANKAKDATRLGAKNVIDLNDSDQLKANKANFDFIIDTVPVSHDINPILGLLKRDSTLLIIGALMEVSPTLRGMSLIDGRKRIAGSDIGGINETQEMLNFCSLHEVFCEVEVVPRHKINEAFKRLGRNDVKYRFVINMKS